MEKKSLLTPTPLKNFIPILRCAGIEELVEEIEKYPTLWDEITCRQEYPESAHKDTRTIYLRGPVELSIWGFLSDLRATNYLAMDALPLCANTIDLMSKALHVDTIARCCIVELPPGGKVLPHIDQGAYANYYERYHMVLTTNDKVKHTSGEETFVPVVGELVKFNNRVMHSAENLGDTPRWMFIFDMKGGLYG